MLTETMQLTFILVMSMKIFSMTGREYSQRNHLYLQQEEKKEWLAGNTDVTIGSDAFFPFGDNIERAYKSGVKYVAQPGGSVRDDQVIETANKRGMAMCFTG